MIFLVTGCSLAPSHERPPLPMAAVYPNVSTVEPQAAPAAVRLGWCEFFTDTRLRKLIALASFRRTLATMA